MKQLWQDTLFVLRQRPRVMLPQFLVALLSFVSSLAILRRALHPAVHAAHQPRTAALHALLVLVVLFGCILFFIALHLVATIVTAQMTKKEFPMLGQVAGSVPLSSLGGEIAQLTGVVLLGVIMSCFIAVVVLLFLLLFLHGLHVPARGWTGRYLMLPVFYVVVILNMVWFVIPRLMKLIATAIFGLVDHVRVAVAQRLMLFVGAFQLVLLACNMVTRHNASASWEREMELAVATILSFLVAAATNVAYTLIASVAIPGRHGGAAEHGETDLLSPV